MDGEKKVNLIKAENTKVCVSYSSLLVRIVLRRKETNSEADGSRNKKGKPHMCDVIQPRRNRRTQRQEGNEGSAGALFQSAFIREIRLNFSEANSKEPDGIFKVGIGRRQDTSCHTEK